MEKIILQPARIREFPPRFGWIDQRLLSPHSYLHRCEHYAWALYLLLVLVGDAQGMSYYSDKRLCKELNCSLSTLRQGRASLIRTQLIAHRQPLYQVLALPDPVAEKEKGASAQEFAQVMKEAGLL